MKILLKTVLIAVCLIPSFLWAQEAPAAPDTLEDDYYRTEQVMANTMHQFVYAFFGKDLLINYLENKDDIRAIREASSSDLLHLAKPFNTLISKFVIAAMVGFYWVTVGYFLLRIIAFSTEYGWLLQRKGTTPMDKETFKSFSIKLILLSGVAVAPMAIKMNDDRHYIALYNLFLFDIMGKAHQMGDEALKEMIINQRPTLNTIRVPHADAKWASGLALNDFMTCLRLDASRRPSSAQETTLTFFHVEDGKAESVLNLGRCNLKLQFGYDTETQRILESMALKNPAMPVNAALFAQAQKEVFSTIIQNTMAQSAKNSETLSRPAINQQYQYLPDSLIKQDFLTAQWTRDALSEYELSLWEQQCDNFNDWSYPSANISRRDRLVYHLISGRCLSKNISTPLLYPDTFGNVAVFFQDKTLANRHLPLCVDEMEFSRSITASRYVPQYQLNAQQQAATEGNADYITQLPLDSCLAKFCSEKSLKAGGLYSCVNALETYRQRQKDFAMQDRGVLMLGFYMFNLYSNQIPTDRAKHIFQSTIFEFSGTAFSPGSKVSADPLFSVKVNLPALNSEHYNTLQIVQDDMVDPFKKEEFQLVEAFDNSSLSTTSMNAMQYSRLLTCARHPLQIAEGYVCGNLPQEFSAFGMNVLRFAIAAKSIVILGDALSTMRNAAPERGTIGTSSIKQGMGPVLAALGVGAVGFGIIDSVMDSGFATTDDFGYLDQKAVRQFMYMNAEQATILSLAILGQNAVGNTLYKALDWALMLLLVTGILFALVIPLMPMLLVMYALVKFLYLLFVTIAMTGINLINAAFEEDPGFLTESVDKIWSDWLALILKLPLLFIGIILAWLMSNVIIAHVLQKMQVTFVTNDGTMGPIDTLVMLVMTFGIIFAVYNTVMSVIESFYDFTVEWILGQMSNSPFSDRRAMGWKDSKDVMALMGR